MGPFRRSLSISICLGALSTQAQVMDLGRGSFLDHLPRGQQGPVDTKGNRVLPRVVAGTPGPFPTNDWWSSLIFPRDPAFPFGMPLFAWPLTVQAKAEGWSVGAPDPTPSSGTEFHYGHVDALLASVEGLGARGVEVAGWTDWTVRARLDDGTRQLEATLGHGLPFVHFRSSGGDALVACLVAPQVWGGEGTDAVGITVAGNHYGLFAPSGSVWSLGGKTFRSSLGGKGRWSLAVLPDNSPQTLARFRRSAFVVPVDTRVTWKVDPARGTLRTTYRVVSTAVEGASAPSLLALFRHQWAYSADVNTSWKYASPRGAMKVVDADSFTTEDAIPAILPALPQPAAADAEAIRSELRKASVGTLLEPAGDTYWAGKGFWRAASLVDLADALGEIRLRDSLLGAIRNELESWFTARTGASEKTGKVFALDPQWGSLVGFPASYGSDAELNDHHFHYGYFVQAAALVARYDKKWAARDAYGAMVELLVADANNPRRGDPRFPFLRHFDPYEGHSWAAGHASFLAGNNNESSSEGMNFSAALALWGMATGNDTLRDAGLWMAATEMRAVEQYWWDVDGAVFPKGFPSKAVGMVWGNGGAHATWFSGEPECIHGINVLPFTPASLQWTRRPDRAGVEWAEMRGEKAAGAFTQWKDVLFAYQSISDAAGAWKDFQAWDGMAGEGGVPRAWYRRWIALLRDHGGLDTSVRALHVSGAVLKKGEVRTYLAWNPGVVAQEVEFSDGHRILVAPGRIAMDQGSAGTGSRRSTDPSGPKSLWVVDLSGLSRWGERMVQVRDPSGRLRFQGAAREAARIRESGLWLVRPATGASLP